MDQHFGEKDTVARFMVETKLRFFLRHIHNYSVTWHVRQNPTVFDWQPPSPWMKTTKDGVPRVDI